MSIDPKIVEQHINLLKTEVEQLKFDTCWQISADYTRFYVISNDPDTIFLGELCQNVFSEMRILFDHYELSSETLTEVQAGLQARLDTILRAMKSGTDTDKYSSLRDLRVFLTKLQFKEWHTGTMRMSVNVPVPEANDAV
ncbi:MAG: hypothetical protein ABSF63_03095 [Candidatus Bathyarchaeia archaeon]|jgi:hypothetical protein